jgi:hypothetical protein
MTLARLITLCLILSTAFVLSSCCKRDTVCVSGTDANLGTLPYAPGEQVVFADGSGRRIVVRFSDAIESSAAYTVTDGGSCIPKSYPDCNRESYIALHAGSVTDSSGVLSAGNTSFECRFSLAAQSSEGVSFSLAAFGAADARMKPDGHGLWYGYEGHLLLVNSFSTPYRTYPNVYHSIPGPNSPQPAGKYVLNAEGRLIAFAANRDTSQMFFVVE